MSDTKYTSPGLAIKIQDTVYWGALYSDSAPQNTLRVKINDTTYWLGDYCEPGTYAPDGTNTCIACGIGHYCTGGHARASCTYGAISCPGTEHASDPAMPAGAPVNQLMTLDEVNEFIPVTDFADWKLISSCGIFSPNVACYEPDSLNNASNGCTGTIGPGTYLFITRYGPAPFTSGFIDSIDGTADKVATAYIAVFDHPVSYASMHGDSIFQHFIDTEHPTYTKWTFSTAPTNCSWNINKNETNVINISGLPNQSILMIYELK